MKRLAMLRNEVGMALAGAKVREEKGDHLLEVLGVIIIAIVILVLFRNALVPKFREATDATSNVMKNLWKDDQATIGTTSGS